MSAPHSRHTSIDRWERDERLDAIYRRPGFMIRRAHQVALGIFADECAAFEMTTQQHGVLTALEQFPGIDQISLGRLLGLDRSTIAGVVGRLSTRGFVRSTVSRLDRRRRTLSVRVAGRRALLAAHDAAERAQDRLLEPLTVRERAQFLTLLQRLLDEHNENARVPVNSRTITAAASRIGATAALTE